MSNPLDRALYRYRNKMNRHVHQIVFTDPGAHAPTGYAERAIRSVRDAFPGCEHRIWNLGEATEFISGHFDRDVARAFDRLAPYAYKADLFKYCLLHVVGGWYVDAGVTMLGSPLRAPFASSANPPGFVLFRSTGPDDAPWNCSVALLYAEPGHDVFTTAIAEVVDNCKNQRYGATPLSPTMSPFGRALAIHDVHQRVRLGAVVDVRRRSYDRAYELPPIGRVAARKPTSTGRSTVGDVSYVGMHGTNNYYEMWIRREAFGTW
jgi:mannosyltransferase OCH1-like enzyme